MVRYKINITRQHPEGSNTADPSDVITGADQSGWGMEEKVSIGICYFNYSIVAVDFRNVYTSSLNNFDIYIDKCRRRVKDGASRANYRKPRGMGAAERSMRKYCELKGAGDEPRYIFEPSIGLAFDSEPEAIEFYNLHSWEVGFGTKLGNWARNKDGYQTIREIVCQRQVTKLEQRCTIHCYYDEPIAESNYTKLLQQSLIYGKALKVARKGNHDFATCDIVMKYLQLAEKKIDEYIEEKNGGATREVSTNNADMVTDNTAHLNQKPCQKISLVHLDHVQG